MPTLNPGKRATKEKTRFGGVGLLTILTVIGISLVSGACTKRGVVRWPEPQIIDRPELTFSEDRTTHEICLSMDEAQRLLIYIDDLETELDNAGTTIKRINNMR